MWHRDAQALAQIEGGIVHALLRGLGPQVQGGAGTAALEAVEGVVLQVDREAAAGARRRAVQRTRATLLGTPLAARSKAEQVQHSGHGDDGPHSGEVDGGAGGGRGCGFGAGGLALLPAAFAGLGQLAIAGLVNLLVAAIEFVLGRDVADGAVQADRVVVQDVIGHDAAGVIERQRGEHADAIALKRLVPAFDFAVALGIIGGGFDVGHAADADELLEVLGDELRSVVADDPRRGAGELFAGALDDGFHVAFLHFLADFPVDDEAAAAVEDGAEEVEGAGDVEVTDIDMPVLVGLEGLDKAGAFFGGLGRVPGQQPRGFEDAVDTGRAASDDVGVEHHEGQVAIAVERMLAGEGTDGLLFRVGKPVVAWHPGVVFVDLAEAVLPVVELAGADADPGEEAAGGDVGLVGPGTDEIDDLVAGVVGNPAAGQGSPSSFFSWTCSSMSSPRTSFLRWSLASSCWILLSLASSTALALRPLSKAECPFSKNSFCQR